MKYMIKDWAGNILNFKGKFDRPEFAVAMQFENQEDAFEYLYENFEEESLQDLFVDELN